MGGINYGTLGFFCADESKNVFLATCDHVIKTLSTPDNGPWKIYFSIDSAYSGKIALYEGKGLVSKSQKTADFALAKVLLDIESKTLLPMVVPSTHVGEFKNTKSPRKALRYFSGELERRLTIIIAIAPRIDWRKERTHLGRWEHRTRYSLVVSITTPEETVDVYTPVANQAGIKVPIEIRTLSLA